MSEPISLTALFTASKGVVDISIKLAKINQPSDVFKNLELQLLELINLQRQCLDIINNI